MGAFLEAVVFCTKSLDRLFVFSALVSMALVQGTPYPVVVRRGILTPYWGNRRPKLTPLVL